jgi:hypothetical protein
MLPNEEEKERKNRKHGIYYQFVVDTTSRGILEYLKHEGSQSFLSNEKKIVVRIPSIFITNA